MAFNLLTREQSALKRQEREARRRFAATPAPAASTEPPPWFKSGAEGLNARLAKLEDYASSPAGKFEARVRALVASGVDQGSALKQATQADPEGAKQWRVAKGISASDTPTTQQTSNDLRAIAIAAAYKSAKARGLDDGSARSFAIKTASRTLQQMNTAPTPRQTI